MQIAISIEPYLAVEKVKLTQYIENIIQLSREMARKGDQVVLHFDYFKPNPEIFELVQSYTDKIAVDLQLMQESVPSVAGFRSVSVDLIDQPANLPTVKPEQAGIVLDLGCEWTKNADLVRAASYIIVMTVKCGKSGQLFQPSAMDLVTQVRAINPKAVIIIDGGVNENNINLLKKAGVDVAVVGNYAKKCYENGSLAIGINRLLHN